MRKFYRVAMMVAMVALVGSALPGSVRAEEDAAAQQTEQCALPFQVVVRQGPSAGSSYPGMLFLRLGPNGEIDRGRFDLLDGTTMSVVGQANGRAINLLLERGKKRIIGVGTGENPIQECSGSIAGLTIGPLPGDSGDWDVCCCGGACPPYPECDACDPEPPDLDYCTVCKRHVGFGCRPVFCQ